MKVVAIVVAHNSARDLPDSLGSLTALPLDRVVVADNASTDDSARVAAAYTPHVLRRANDGFGAGVNAAAASAPDADAYLLFNPDCRIGPADFAALRAALKEGFSAVAPRMRYPDGRFGVSSGSAPSMAKEWIAALRLDEVVPAGLKRRLAASRVLRSLVPMLAYLDVAPAAGTTAVDWVSGFCMLVRADAFRAAGGFDERFFLYFEDVDLCVRLRAAGGRVGAAGASVAEHKESTSTAAVGKKRLYRDGMAVYFGLHGGRAQRLSAHALRRFPG
ncbi:glycosyltransferase family 2 protein [Asanoa sp. NPDC049518]|uniref:glycosyltransferase family 2 protein n=1 Tax=unclassified Asanoa TaxID=2685164 RepID=UPI00342AB014